MTTKRNTHEERAAECVDGFAPRTMLDEVAEVTVQFMYRELDDQVLRDMLIHGNEMVQVPLVVALNKSIQNELDRRQREREELEAGR